MVTQPKIRELVIGSYNGTGDPQSHVDAFQTQMFTSGGNNAINCKMFAGTLAEVALKWFKGLPMRMVTSFEDLIAGSYNSSQVTKRRK